MPGYRIYYLGFDSYLIGAESITCASDADAVAAARQTLRTYAAVEVWDGDRKVERLEAASFFQPEQTADSAPVGHE